MAGAPLAIDHDAGVNLQPGAVRQLEVKLDADTDHHQIESLRIAAFTADPGGAVAILQRDFAAAAAYRYALLPVQLEQRL
ncbi:hypothetical protein D3C80_1970110 [compost metagenome]